MEALGGFLEPLGRLLGALEGSEAAISVILGCLGGILGALGALLEPLGGVLEALGSLLGASWEHSGGTWELFGSYIGAWNASLKRFAEILKIIEFHWRVLQKSRSGGSEISEKSAQRASLDLF